VDVDLCGNGIGREGAVALAEGVAASGSLAALALDNNDLRDEGAKALLQACCLFCMCA
jgi:Ran GTPase-activating protein (RanGAP) involved in mRNA processing and transport